jgi:flavorubredoxin
MEPDHAATLNDLVIRYPEVKVITNAKAIKMIEQFFSFDIKSRALVVNDGDTFSSGKHNFTFIMAPMVHWPETMVTYDSTDKILFSADAFGSFGALNGNLFADEVNYDRDWIDEARRYYTNIVGKYGAQVQALLKKASTLDIQIICPLHGHVWRENLSYIIEKNNIWSSYEAEEKSVAIIYGSIYGNTENAVNILANKLSQKGIKNIKMYDVSKTHPSYIVSECFKCSHLVFASSTYNGGIFTNMETVLLDLKAHLLQNRTVAVIDNGTWGAIAGKKMIEIFESMKNIKIIEETAKLSSSVKENNFNELEAIANKLAEDF